MKTTEPTCQELKDKISELEAKLVKTQWLHDKENIAEKEPYIPFYGDVTELNTERSILDNVGKETLEILTSELMDLLDTSVAIYERNGDYAYGVFNSGWCQILDAASRKLCNTDNNKTALNCGKWLCHDDCWNNSAKAAIIAQKSTDIACPGGMRLFAEPVFAGNEVIGSINIGYGNPPTNDETLKEIADKFSIGFETLKQKALAYNPRPDYIIEIAKKRLKSIAKLIGEIVQRKQSEQELKERVKELDCISQFSKLAVKKNNIDDILNELTYLLKKSFSVPEITEVRIKNDGITYQTDNFRETPFMLQSYIIVEQKKKGIIEIAILQDKTNKPVTFLEEEYKLLQVITERLNSIIERLKINKKYKLLSENVSDGIVLIEDDKIKYVSPGVAQLLGRNLEELKQITLDEIFSFIHPEDTQRIRNKVYEAHKNQVKNYRYEYRSQKANGEYIWVEDALNSEYDENGNRIRTIIRARDITKRKQAEQALKESEEKFRKAFETHSAVKLIIDPTNGSIFDANIAASEFYGWSQHRLKQMKIQEINTLSPDEVKNEMISAKEHKKNHFDFSHKIKNGSIKDVEVYSTSFKLQGKDLLHSIIHDVTDRKKAEQALQEKTSFLSTIMETSPVGITTVDKTGTITYANNRAEQILGLVKEEITSRTYDAPLWKHTDIDGSSFPDEKQPFNIVKKTLKTVFDIQHGITWPDGTVVILSINAAPIKDNTGKFNGMIASFEDITELKKAEQALKEYSKKLEEANATKDRFISVLGHDLRSPFNTLLGFSDLLIRKVDKYDKEQLKTFASTIHTTAQHTYNLLINLLEWSKSQRDKIPFNPQTANLYTLAYETYMLLKESSEAKKIEIKLDIPEQLEIEADRDMVRTVIRNLLSNAVKFTRENGFIHVSVKETAQTVKIAISDNGTGMDETIKNSLFKIGETTSKKGTSNEKGTGLGLLLCKEFTDKHNGSIHVESEPGEGSTFIVTLPVKQEMNN